MCWPWKHLVKHGIFFFFQKVTYASHTAPLFIVSHGNFPQSCIIWALGFVTSNLILDGLNGWHVDRSGCASLPMIGCTSSVNYSQAAFSCQTAGMHDGLYFLSSEIYLVDFIRPWNVLNITRASQKRTIGLQIAVNVWAHSHGLHAFHFLPYFMGSWHKKTFATKKILMVGHQN